MAVALVMLAISSVALWFMNKDENAQAEVKEQKVLNDFVHAVKDEIEKLKSKYPKLSSDAVVEGNNAHKHYDQGNIYDDFTNLTFPIHTPTTNGVDSSGGSTLESLNYITLTVSGTVSDYKITGVSRLSRKKAFKVIYSSKHGNAIEGMIA